MNKNSITKCAICFDPVHMHALHDATTLTDAMALHGAMAIHDAMALHAPSTCALHHMRHVTTR